MTINTVLSACIVVPYTDVYPLPMATLFKLMTCCQNSSMKSLSFAFFFCFFWGGGGGGIFFSFFFFIQVLYILQMH